MKAKILFVDDELDAISSTAQVLTSHGYEVITAGDDAEALYYYDQFQPDLIILDIPFGYDERKGIDILKEIRELVNDKMTPIIMLTGLSEAELEWISIDLGADDFILKSDPTQALLSRVKRRLPRYMRESFIDDFITIDLSSLLAKVKRDGEWQDVHLQRKEWKVLSKLMSNPGRVITRDVLEDLFPESEDPADSLDSYISKLRRKANSLDSCISKLRRKLEPDPGKPRYILTRKGIGYMGDFYA